MDLFIKFKENVPDNQTLCKKAANKILQDKSEKDIKKLFSPLFDKMQEEIYHLYLDAEEKSGQSIIDSEISKNGTVRFSDMNKFLMSISQSRKSRAGKAFEFIIRELFKRLSYPFSEQVNIDGAKPDFVMPSAEYYHEKPLDSIIFTAKRTLRERWRQVVTESNKGYGFFLATIDNKVSQNQINEAAKHKIYLVVPTSLKNTNEIYSKSYNVISFEQFFEQHLDPALKRWR